MLKQLRIDLTELFKGIKRLIGGMPNDPYIQNVIDAERRGLTYAPSLYNNDPLPRIIEESELE